MMQHFRHFISLFLVLTVFSISAIPLYAAEFYSGESVFIAENQTELKDIYTFGNTVTIDAPVDNDLVAAGNIVTLNGDVSGSIIAAGGTVVIRSNTGNAMRVAGGEVAISGTINGDVLIAAGKARVMKEASISGDLIFAGEELTLEGEVDGKALVYGERVTVANKVGGNVEGTVGSLTLSPGSIVEGNLMYKADEKAKVANGATVVGKHEFKQRDVSEDSSKQSWVSKSFSSAAFYKLITDILVSLLLLALMPKCIARVIERAFTKPAYSTGIGFLFLILWPLLSLFLLFLLWIGLASFLFYGLIVILSVFVGKILTGWYIMRWFEAREKREYILDWKAGVVGALVFFVLFLIPVIGWIIAFIIYLTAMGALLANIVTAVRAFPAITKIEQPNTKHKE